MKNVYRRLVGRCLDRRRGGAKAKFANDYNAGKFKDVIADGEQLRKNNALDAQSQLIVGQAYYKASDYAGCVKYIKTISAQSDTALELQARCAYESRRRSHPARRLEQLVARSGKPEYWKGLLKLGERSRGLHDHNTLDINRLRFSPARSRPRKSTPCWRSWRCSWAMPPRPRA